MQCLSGVPETYRDWRGMDLGEEGTVEHDLEVSWYKVKASGQPRPRKLGLAGKVRDTEFVPICPSFFVHCPAYTFLPCSCSLGAQRGSLIVKDTQQEGQSSQRRGFLQCLVAWLGCTTGLLCSPGSCLIATGPQLPHLESVKCQLCLYYGFKKKIVQREVDK